MAIKPILKEIMQSTIKEIKHHGIKPILKKIMQSTIKEIKHHGH